MAQDITPSIIVFSKRDDVGRALEDVGTIRAAGTCPSERPPALLVADLRFDDAAEVVHRVSKWLGPGDAVVGILGPNGECPGLYLDGEARDLGQLAETARELLRLLSTEIEVQARAVLRERIHKVVREPEAVRLMEAFVAEHMALHRRLQSQLERRTEDLQRSLHDLQEAQAQLVQAEKMVAIGQLAAGFAHEINNPLGVILGFAHGLDRRVPDDSPLRLPVASIVREAVRCKNLVQSLLTFSRNAGGRCELFDVNAVLRSAIALLATRARMQNVTMSESLADRIPALQGNKTQIEQVIINLGNNALDAMQDGGALSIRTSPTESGIEIEVTDTGCGMSDEVLRRIFEPFFTTKEPGKGTGLGLSLAYEMVRKHGGTIDVNSRPGAGTRVMVQLPSRERAAGEEVAK